jgi:hypothetical protein
MNKEITERAREFVLAVYDRRSAIITDDLINFASAESERAVREFVAQIKTGINGPNHPWTVLDIAFESMFGKKLEEGE